MASNFHKPEDGITSDNYSVKINTNLPRNYFTFDFGVGLEWLFSKTKSWKLFFVYDYTICSKKIMDITVSNASSINYSHLESSGNYQSFTFGIGYRISNLWTRN